MIVLQDWLDIDFAVQNRVDFIAVSFVKSADVMYNLKSYVRSRSPGWNARESRRC